MKKKIQVSSVKVESLAQVIMLNASFVARAIRVADYAAMIKDNMVNHCPPKQVVDENGDPVVDENGNDVYEPDLTHRSFIDVPCAQEAIDKLFSFLEDLEDALLGGEE